MGQAWDDMLAEFRRLGGIAENIEQRPGQYGNGIFPVDPSRPVEIFVPGRLLIDEDQYQLQGDELVINPALDIEPEVRGFLDSYQKQFSWGGSGRRDCERFEISLANLPTTVLDPLKKYRLLDVGSRHQDGLVSAAYRHFLVSRRINHQHRKVLMPIIELINHASGSPGYVFDGGIGFKGTSSDEVTVNYSNHSDALMRFLTYGFASHELRAYSVPFQCKLGDGRRLVIGYDLADVVPGGGVGMPVVRCDARNITLSHLVIASERTPRLPRSVFREVLKELAQPVVDEIFDRVRGFNIQVLCDFLTLLDGLQQEVAQTFGKALRYQLWALSHCYGSRQLPSKHD